MIIFKFNEKQSKWNKPDLIELIVKNNLSVFKDKDLIYNISNRNDPS